MVAVAAGVWLALALAVVIAWPRITAHRAWRAAALVAALVFAFVHQLVYATVVDTAFITFRYAENLADGYGPVFNPGEAVEGYGNFLWLVLIAMSRTTFGVSVTTAAVVLGVTGALACVLAAYGLANRIVQRAQPHGPGAPALGVAAAVLMAGVGSLAAYGPSGLSTPLFILLVLLVCHALVAGRPVVAGVLVALAVMTRPDGVVVATVGGLWLVAQAVRRRTTALSVTAYVLGALVILVPWTAWRVTVYGYLIPNAIVVQSGGAPATRLRDGWDYLTGFVLAYQALILLAVVTVAMLVARRRHAGLDAASARSAVWLLLALAGTETVFVVVVGGEPQPGWRLLAPVAALLAVAATAAYGIATLTGSPSPTPRRSGLGSHRAVPAVALATCAACLVVTPTHPRMLPAMHAWGTATTQLGEIGAWLGRNLPPGTVIATETAGALAYRAGPSLVVVDARGRTDEHIARSAERYQAAGRPGVVARDDAYLVTLRRPAVVVETADGYTDEQDCGMNPAYAGPYEVASFRRAGAQQWVSLYVRRDDAEWLIRRLGEDPQYEYVPCA